MRHWAALILALCLSLGLARSSRAALAPVLSPTDAQQYSAAFDAIDRGDFIDAVMQTVDLHDPTLAGYLTFRQLMHPTAHRSNYTELADWLGRYGDLPMAERIYALAGKRKPVDAQPLAVPELAGLDWSTTPLVPPGTGGPFDLDNTRLARLAFYTGDPKRAFDLASATGDHWIAGMAAYRLARFDQAESHLAKVARNQREDRWIRAGGAYWASRASEAAGRTDRSPDYLRLAASVPESFYGMIAERQLTLRGLAAPSTPLDDPYNNDPPPSPKLVRVAASTPSREVVDLVRNDPRAHRAAALAQIGRIAEAADELRAGLAEVKIASERSRWLDLALTLNAALATDEVVASQIRKRNPPDYPTPPLRPRMGFTIDKALVYAIVRQESRFNPGVVSPAGAVGLMQLMPDTAAQASRNPSLRNDMSPLFDPG